MSSHYDCSCKYICFVAAGPDSIQRHVAEALAATLFFHYFAIKCATEKCLLIMIVLVSSYIFFVAAGSDSVQRHVAEALAATLFFHYFAIK